MPENPAVGHSTRYDPEDGKHPLALLGARAVATHLALRLERERGVTTRIEGEDERATIYVEYDAPTGGPIYYTVTVQEGQEPEPLQGLARQVGGSVVLLHAPDGIDPRLATRADLHDAVRGLGERLGVALSVKDVRHDAVPASAPFKLEGGRDR